MTRFATSNIDPFVPNNNTQISTDPAQNDEQIYIIEYICWHGEAKTKESDEILAASAEDAVKTWLEDNNRDDISFEITPDGVCRFSEPDDFDTDEELWVREDMFYFKVRVSGPYSIMTCPTYGGEGNITVFAVNASYLMLYYIITGFSIVIRSRKAYSLCRKWLLVLTINDKRRV